MTLDSRIQKVTGRGIVVRGNEIDTDRIMPARYLKCVTFAELGQYAFQDERFDQEGRPKAHPFNDARHKGANVLFVNKNFGCGSSREHAPQGLHRWGIQAIVGESFAEIFAGNCTAIGVPTATAPEADVRRVMADIEKDPSLAVTLDVEKKELAWGGNRIPVDVRDSARKVFLEGAWDTAATLLAAQAQLKQTADRIPYLHWAGAR